jgi:hypothetical protein
MSTNTKATTTKKEKLVLDALSDPNWDFRTVNGVARSCHINEEEVEHILHNYQMAGIVRKYIVPDIDGQELFSLKKNKNTRELMDSLRVFISKSLK